MSRAGLSVGWRSRAWRRRTLCFQPLTPLAGTPSPSPLSAINRWQTVTDLEITKATLESLSQYCSEFLVHAADVEGLCQGIDEVRGPCCGASPRPLPPPSDASSRDFVSSTIRVCCFLCQELVTVLGEISPIPCCYAGGGKSIEDLAKVCTGSTARRGHGAAPF